MKTKRKRLRLRAATPPLTHAQIEQIIGGFTPFAVVPASPPTNPPAPKAAPPAPGPILWNFTHTHPQLPNAILHLCVEAPTIAEARGKAYLLAENFCGNVIGFLKANAGVQLPGR